MASSKTDKTDKPDKAKPKSQISPPNFKTCRVVLVGTADYVMNKFSQEARDMMAAKQAEGAKARKRRPHEPKDFDRCYRGAMHLLEDDTHGVPASGFRQAMISACRVIGFKMTLAKLALFVHADGKDKDDGSPLVRIEGTPRRVDSFVQNETGVADVRPRPHFAEGWKIRLRVKYDADLFTDEDVRNLLRRVGLQVGIGAGRPDSKQSAGQGWGTFRLEGDPIPDQEEEEDGACGGGGGPGGWVQTPVREFGP